MDTPAWSNPMALQFVVVTPSTIPTVPPIFHTHGLVNTLKLQSHFDQMSEKSEHHPKSEDSGAVDLAGIENSLIQSDTHGQFGTFA
jgi:hypothetical protein